MVTFAPPDSPADAAFSVQTHRDSSSLPQTQSGSVKFIAAITDKKIKPEASAKKNIRPQPPTGQCVFNVQFDDGSHDVESFFRQAPYGVKISIVATSNALLIVVSFLDAEAGQSLINRDFLPST